MRVSRKVQKERDNSKRAQGRDLLMNYHEVVTQPRCTRQITTRGMAQAIRQCIEDQYTANMQRAPDLFFRPLLLDSSRQGNRCVLIRINMFYSIEIALDAVFLTMHSNTEPIGLGRCHWGQRVTVVAFDD
jgi:hypothetical protein